MEKRSSHYKVSRAQFVLIDRVVVYTRFMQCTLAAVSLGRMLIFVIRLIIVHKLAPPVFIWGHVAFTLKSIAYRCGDWSVSLLPAVDCSKYVMNCLHCWFM